MLTVECALVHRVLSTIRENDEARTVSVVVRIVIIKIYIAVRSKARGINETPLTFLDQD